MRERGAREREIERERERESVREFVCVRESESVCERERERERKKERKQERERKSPTGISARGRRGGTSGPGPELDRNAWLLVAFAFR